MRPFTDMRDALRGGGVNFKYLDATQLVKHAFGLVTQGRKMAKSPILVYLFAEPKSRGLVLISPETHALHRAEIAKFATLVSGAAVHFASCSYRDWFAGWTGDAAAHASALVDRFQP